VRKLLFIFSLALAVAFGAAAAESLTLTDGSTQAGDIVKFDDNGLMLRGAGDAYVNVPWGKLSQDSLKHLAENPKFKPLVEVFIEPDASARPAKPEIHVGQVTRMERPARPSLFGGLFGSPVGLFLLLVLYAANLYAGYEISIVRARPAVQVIGLSAVLPIIGPVVFLAMPMKVEAPVEEVEHAAPAGTAAAAAQRPPEEIQVAEASWKNDEKKAEPQVFARGKFTFNKRFIETKFVGYFGTPRGEALKFTMEVKTASAQFAVARIMQVSATEVIFETAQPAQVTVPLNDIMEIKLTPKPA
jgi:ribosome maturation factor RimP